MYAMDNFRMLSILLITEVLPAELSRQTMLFPPVHSGGPGHVFAPMDA